MIGTDRKRAGAEIYQAAELQDVADVWRSGIRAGAGRAGLDLRSIRQYILAGVAAISTIYGRTPTIQAASGDEPLWKNFERRVVGSSARHRPARYQRG